MQSARLIPVTVFVLAMAIDFVGMHANRAQAQEEYVSKAKATKLLQTALAGVPGKSVHVVHFSAPPGFVGGRHSHPGPAFVYIHEGQLTITMDGDAPVTLGPGDLFEEPVGNKVMQATNESSTHGVMCGRLPVGKVSFDVDASWSGAVMCPAC